MAVIADWIEDIAGDETIECVIVGDHDNDYWKDEKFNGVMTNTPISWEEARPFLSYEYDNGFGGADCHPVFAYTPTKIITITEYDGATGPSWYPRHPIKCRVGFDGVEDYG